MECAVKNFKGKFMNFMTYLSLRRHGGASTIDENLTGVVG